MSSKRSQKKAAFEAKKAAYATSSSENQPIAANIVKTPQELMKLVCKLSLSSGSFVDTKFYAYSRRKPSGKVYSPKAVYANSYILRIKAPEYFGPLLQGDYKGNCATGPLSGSFPSDFLSEGDGEGYDSDSDLEDDEEDDNDQPDGIAFKKEVSTIDTLEGSSSSWDMGDEKGKSAEESDRSKDTKKAPEDTNAGEGGVNGPETSNSESVGKIRLMEGFAYTTWKAFVFYLYTGEVNFSPLKSQGLSQMPSDVARREATTATPPQCSSKSMYRLADELGLEDLKEVAKNDIQSKLSSKNILAELFSSFTMKYDEIKDMEIEYACANAKDTVTSDIYAQMRSLPLEDLEHSIGIIASLIQKLGNSATLATSHNLHCKYCGTARMFRCTSCNTNWSR